MIELMTKKPEKVLLTGGAGYLGQYLTKRLSAEFFLRVLDVLPAEGAQEFVRGSVADSAVVEKAMEGMDALVIAHMAPNRDEVYKSVDLPLDINVKGTAALLHAARARGIRRVVLISSIAVVDGWRAGGTKLTADLEPNPNPGLYGLTKMLQESTARFYHQKHGMEFVVLRPAYVITQDPLEDKYGRKPPTVNWQFIDPIDIAEAAALGLKAEKVGFDVYYTLAGPGCEEKADMKAIRNGLGWVAKNDFSKYPPDA